MRSAPLAGRWRAPLQGLPCATVRLPVITCPRLAPSAVRADRASAPRARAPIARSEWHVAPKARDGRLLPGTHLSHSEHRHRAMTPPLTTSSSPRPRHRQQTEKLSPRVPTECRLSDLLRCLRSCRASGSSCTLGIRGRFHRPARGRGPSASINSLGGYLFAGLHALPGSPLVEAARLLAVDLPCVVGDELLTAFQAKSELR